MIYQCKAAEAAALIASQGRPSQIWSRGLLIQVIYRRRARSSPSSVAALAWVIWTGVGSALAPILGAGASAVGQAAHKGQK